MQESESGPQKANRKFARMQEPCLPEGGLGLGNPAPSDDHQPPATHCPSERMSPSACNRVPAVGCWKKKHPVSAQYPHYHHHLQHRSSPSPQSAAAASFARSQRPLPGNSGTAPCRKVQTQLPTNAARYKGANRGERGDGVSRQIRAPGAGSEGQESQAVPAPANMGSRTQSSGPPVPPPPAPKLCTGGLHEAEGRCPRKGAEGVRGGTPGLRLPGGHLDLPMHQKARRS